MGGNTTTISKNGDIPSENRAVGLWYAFILSSSMTNAKNVYVLLLALIIVLSGCFGNATPDADGQSNNNQNMDPLIEVGPFFTTEGVPLYSSTNGELIGFTLWNVTVYRAVADLDGSIESSGWDFDLDGIIDHVSNSFQSVDHLSIPAIHWTNTSSISPDWDEGQIATIAFIATDDDGATSAELLSVTNSFESGWIGATSNSYTADDADADTTDGTDDALISMRWQHAGGDLNWADVVIKLSVGDNTYDCAPDASQECTIGQDGDDDSVWETGEFLILSESGSDIAGASGATTIDVYVTYRGTAVAGDDSVTVS